MPKFVIRAPRVIEDDYIHASPEEPKIVDIPDRFFKKDKAGKWVHDYDPSLELYDGGTPEPTKLKPHYADLQRGQDIKLGPQAPPPTPTEAKQGNKRAADQDAI